MLTTIINIYNSSSNDLNVIKNIISNILKEKFKIKEIIEIYTIKNYILINELEKHFNILNQIGIIIRNSEKNYNKEKLFNKLKKELKNYFDDIIKIELLSDKDKPNLKQIYNNYFYMSLNIIQSLDNYKDFIIKMIKREILSSDLFNVEFIFYENFGKITTIDIYQNPYNNIFKFNLNEKNRYMDMIEYLNNELRNYIFYITSENISLIGYDEIIDEKVSKRYIVNNNIKVNLSKIKRFKKEIKNLLINVIKEYLYNDIRTSRNNNVMKYFKDINKILENLQIMIII